MRMVEKMAEVAQRHHENSSHGDTQSSAGQD